MKSKEILTVVLITIFILISLASYLMLFFIEPMPFILRAIIATVITFFSFTAIKVLRQRIKEIRSDYTDDISKY